MCKISEVVVLATLFRGLFALTGEEIIARVDDNQIYNSIEYHATMTISMGNQVREKSFEGYAQGEEQAYMEFTAPARDKGTRFLKLGNEMWMYIPAVEKATKIAGHMLRQSLMGSDFSYDDFTENERMEDLYAIELVGTDSVEGNECFVLDLIAKVDVVTYFKRKLWVTKDTYIPIKAELYAKSGKLMKEITISDFEKIDGHNYPTKIKMVNKLRKDTYTELVLKDITLDAEIPKKIFTKAYLERK